MADQKITFDGDSTGLVAALNRTAAALEKQKAGAKGIGEEMGKTFASMAKGTVIATGLAAALSEAAKWSERMRTASAKSSEDRGKEAVSVSVALAKSRMTTQQIEGVTGFIGEGATTADETSAFITQLGKKRGKRLDFGEAVGKTAAFTSGMFTSDELMEMRRAPTAADIETRRQRLTPEALDEIEKRKSLRAAEAERRAQNQGRDASRFVEGEKQRRREAGGVTGAAQTALEAIRSGVSKVPIVGPLLVDPLESVENASIERQVKGQLPAKVELGSDSMNRLARPPAPTIINGAKE